MLIKGIPYNEFLHLWLRQRVIVDKATMLTEKISTGHIYTYQLLFLIQLIYQSLKVSLPSSIVQNPLFLKEPFFVNIGSFRPLIMLRLPIIKLLKFRYA